MKRNLLYLVYIVISLLACKPNTTERTIESSVIPSSTATQEKSNTQDQHLSGTTIISRFTPPKDYERGKLHSNSFGNYLSNLRLKPAGTQVKYYNGGTKGNNDVYDAVIDLEIGNKDLHQCADAVMRLRAEYLWNQQSYDDIAFNFTNGHRVAYSEWMNGNRMQVQGNKTKWIDKMPPSNTYQDFWNYMELIFMYAGTASLEKELNPVEIKDAKIGDVLIQGGHPGHAVIIVDKAQHHQTGKSIYLLAQSYMPAQEIQLLRNPTDSEISPWYGFEEDVVSTPEWTFRGADLSRF